MKHLDEYRDKDLVQWCTAEIDRAETRINEINEAFCDPTYFERTPRKEITKLEKDRRTLDKNRETLEANIARWESRLIGIDQERRALLQELEQASERNKNARRFSARAALAGHRGSRKMPAGRGAPT